MRVVIDTNVLISALLFGGTPGELIPLWQNGRIIPLASREIVDEYIKVLAYPKFELTEAEITYLLHYEILPYFEIVASPSRATKVLVGEDPSDDKFLLCAKRGKAKYIITGDHHLLKLRSYAKLKILTVTQFLSEMQEK